MPKPPSHPRYRAATRSEPYPSGANRIGGGNSHGGHGHSERGSTGTMYHPAVSENTAGVTPGVPPAQHQPAAPQNYGHGPNTGIGAGYGPGVSEMMNIQYGSGFPATTITSTPRTIPRNFGQQSSPSSSSYFGQSFSASLQGPNQHNSSPTSAPNFQLTGYQHHQPLQQPLQQSLQHHSLQSHQHQQQHQSPSTVNQNATYGQPNQYRPQSHQPQSQPQQPVQHQQFQSHQQTPFESRPQNPESPTYNPHPRSPGHNPTTPWTAHEDTLLLSLRASRPGRPPMAWSELQRLHFPGKSANACRKRHERLIEKRQAEEELDEERSSKIAGEYVRMRDQLWKGLAEKVGMSVEEVEERCMKWGVGGLRVGSRKGRRRGRQTSFPNVVAETGPGPGPGLGMNVGIGVGGMFQGQGQQQHQMGIGAGGMTMRMGGDKAGEEAKNYTLSSVQIGSTGRSPTGPGPGPGPAPGNVGPGSGAGLGMPGVHALNILPPTAVPPLTTQVPISTASSGPASTGASITLAPQMPLLPLTISPSGLALNQQHHQQPRVAFGGYLNGRSTATSRRQASQSVAPPTSISPALPATGNAMGVGAYDQQGQGQQWHQQGGTNAVSGMGVTGGNLAPIQQPSMPEQTRQEQPWYSAAYPPSSFG